jgi:hypothetical protein
MVPKEKRSKFDARLIRCRFLGYSEHEKAYRFEEIESGRVLVSRDAKLMKDMFDSGRRDRRTNEFVVEEDDEAADHDSPQLDETDHENKESVQDEEFEPGSKRHQRTQSLEKMSAAAQDFEAAYVVDSVGEMPTTFKLAMESSDAAKW